MQIAEAIADELGLTPSYVRVAKVAAAAAFAVAGFQPGSSHGVAAEPSPVATLFPSPDEVPAEPRRGPNLLFYNSSPHLYTPGST